MGTILGSQRGKLIRFGCSNQLVSLSSLLLNTMGCRFIIFGEQELPLGAGAFPHVFCSLAIVGIELSWCVDPCFLPSVANFVMGSHSLELLGYCMLKLS